MNHALYKLQICVAALLACLSILVPLSYAQVAKVKDFDLDPHRDRRVLFDMAVTPTKEVLSLVAKDTGEWELYRAANWLDQKPTIEKLPLPGFFSKRDSKRDGKPIETMRAQVFATRDGKYAICVGSAEWLKRVSGWAVGHATSDDVISVVDLSTFKIVATAQTESFELLEFHGVVLDDDGFVRVESSSSGLKHGAFVRLSIPSLEAGPKCAYDWIEDSPGKRYPQPTTDEECHEILKTRALGDYLHEGQVLSAQNVKVCVNNNSEFCHIPGELTADGKFGVGHRSDGHDNFFGSWVTTSNSYVIFSASRGIDIGEIKEPTNDSFHSSLASVRGQDYLLVLQSGTHLMVYELQDRASVPN